MGANRDAAPARRAAWVFDVDGCLIDLISGSSLRPLVTEVFDALRENGIDIVVWSAGGGDYARRRAATLGFEAQVVAFHSKSERDANGCWCSATIDAAHRPVMFVDDRPDELSPARSVMGVRPYIASSRHDRGLEEVLRTARTTPAV